MPAQLIAPLIKTFELSLTDEILSNEGEPTTVTIRQATQAQHRERQDLFATLERRFQDDKPKEVSVIQTLSMEALKEKEAYLSIIECNLLDEDGSILFPSSKTKDGKLILALKPSQFSVAWGKLQPEIAEEIHDKILEVNPKWRGPEGEGL